MTDENPYAAVVAASAPVPGKHYRLRRFLILNAILLGLPIVLALAVWVILALNGVQISGSSGSLGLVTLLVAVGYIAIPNLIMVILQRDKTSSGDHE